MGKITASIDGREVFRAEAEHRFSPPLRVDVANDYAGFMRPAQGASLLGWIAMGQALAEKTGKRLTLQQTGFIGGMMARA